MELVQHLLWFCPPCYLSWGRGEEEIGDFLGEGGGGKKSPPQLHGADKILFYSIMKALDCEKDHVYSLLYRLSEMFNF